MGVRIGVKREEQPDMNLTVFGAASVTAMMICYALESRQRAFTLAFACACFASSAYGWLAGTWPFGVVELIWGLVALRKWWIRDPDHIAGGAAR
jgi:hypothetical protein